MKKPDMTFWEALKASWERELEIGDPSRILRLARETVRCTFAHVFFFELPNALRAAGKRWQEKEDKKNKR